MPCELTFAPWTEIADAGNNGPSLVKASSALETRTLTIAVAGNILRLPRRRPKKMYAGRLPRKIDAPAALPGAAAQAVIEDRVFISNGRRRKTKRGYGLQRTQITTGALEKRGSSDRKPRKGHDELSIAEHTSLPPQKIGESEDTAAMTAMGLPT